MWNVSFLVGISEHSTFARNKVPEKIQILQNGEQL